MKKRTLSAIAIFALVVSLSIITFTQGMIEQDTPFPSLNATSRPIFYGADENTTEVVARNIAALNGSVILADPYENVTIWYRYLGGDNESAPFLFGDDGKTGSDALSWDKDEGILMTYDNETTVEKNDGYGYYNYTFNMSTSFTSFYARYGEYEDMYKIPNLITTEAWQESYFVEDIYTQYEDISLDIMLHNYNITGYGLMYRELDLTDETPFENVTYSFTDEGVAANVTASFAHSFAPDTIVEIKSFLIQYDNITQEERILVETKVRLKTIVDGDPDLTIESKPFTNSLNVSILWEAEAINSNITAVEIDWDDGTGIESISNLSIHRIYHLYASSGEYNIEVTAYAHANAASTTEDLLVLIENIPPTGIIQLKISDSNIIDLNETTTIDVEVEKKQLTFIVSGSDEGSGVEKLIIITDEGNTFEKSTDSEVTVVFLEYGLHVLTFKVVDLAGNEFSMDVTVNLIEKELPGDFGVPFPFGLVTVLGLFAIVLIYMKKRK